ncbi:MAG: glycosyltransferase family 4 protein [Phycisphaerae bacterium]|nr:glycosyltransferase family 4 protein [Phycisphaerae bacterium]
MRIGLYHEPLHADGQSYDTYGSYARYVLEFARHFDHVTVFAPVTDQPSYFSGVPLDASNITVAPLPYFETHIQAYRRAPSIVRTFRAHCDSLNVINARGTAPLAYVLWWLTRKRGVPFMYHFSSDPFEMIARSPKYKGWHGYFAWTAYSCEFAVQKYIMRRNYSFTDGSGISERLKKYTPNVEPIVLSTLRADDYYLRADCCIGDVVRVLYVGYLREGKGLNDLVEAVGILRREGRDVELDLVGTGEMQDSLEAQTNGLGLQGHVHFRGYITLGPELNEYYNSADVFALPSLSEGSPRVITEAMGHSLPIVATPVGNIAESLGDGQRGVLILLNDPKALAAGIARLIDDGEFRRQCIRAGYDFARRHGLDVFVERMAAKAHELIRRTM